MSSVNEACRELSKGKGLSDLIETFLPTIEILVAYKHSQVSFTKLNLAKRR